MVNYSILDESTGSKQIVNLTLYYHLLRVNSIYFRLILFRYFLCCFSFFSFFCDMFKHQIEQSQEKIAAWRRKDSRKGLDDKRRPWPMPSFCRDAVVRMVGLYICMMVGITVLLQTRPDTRVGRGGNARFPTFQLDDPGWTDGRTKPLIELRVRN